MTHDLEYGTDATENTESAGRGLPTKWHRQFRRARATLIYSSAYLSIVAMAEAAVATALLSLPPTIAPAIVGLVTFAVYASDRVADVDDDELADPRRAAFVRRHRDALEVASALAYGVAIALSVLGGPWALAITLAPGIVWVLYAVEAVPVVASGVRRLKDVLVVNTTVVALAWAITLTCLPLAFADRPVTPAAAVVAAYFFLRSFVDTEIPNLGDVEADRAAGVSTIPTVAGVAWTRRALYAVDGLSATLVAWAAAAGHLPGALAAALLAGLAYSLVVVSRVGRTDDVDGLAFASECEYLVVAAALVPAVVGW